MKAIIFAAGQSTRTVPLTLTRPKPLLPVANKPILAHQLDALAGLVDTVFLIVGYKREMIRQHFGDRYGDIHLEYVAQEEQRGTGHALLLCENRVTEPFFALNGDDLYAAEDIATLHGFNQGALAKRVDDPRLFGVYEMGEGDHATGIVEKPERPVSNLANVGFYKFTPEVFDILRTVKPSPRGEIEITSAIQTLAEWGEFRVAECAGYWLPIGYAWNLLDANEYWLANKFEPAIHGKIADGVTVNGPLYLGHNSVIRPGVVIDGPVCIGDNCVVGPNAWLRPGATLGNHCKAGQGVEIKNSIIMEGTAVPHLTYVGDSIVGANANLGCGTITSNFRHDGKNHHSMIKGQLVDTGRRKLGAIIGDGVHTGIHTSIYPGRKLWPGVTTLPGEVVQRDKES